MGFASVHSPHGGDNPNWVALLLPHDNVLPNIPTHAVVIASSYSGDDWSDTFTTQGVFDDGFLQLARDFSCYNSYYYDARLKISFDGTQLYCDKAKYMRDHGLEFDSPWIRIRSVKLG